MIKLWSYGLIVIFFLNIFSIAVIAGKALPAEEVFELNDETELEDHELLENSGFNNRIYNDPQRKSKVSDGLSYKTSR